MLVREHGASARAALFPLRILSIILIRALLILLPFLVRE